MSQPPKAAKVGDSIAYRGCAAADWARARVEWAGIEDTSAAQPWPVLLVRCTDGRLAIITADWAKVIDDGT